MSKIISKNLTNQKKKVNYNIYRKQMISWDGKRLRRKYLVKKEKMDHKENI